MKHLTKLILSLSILLVASTIQANETSFEKGFALTIEKWVKNSSGQFVTTSNIVKDKIITLRFDHSTLIETFEDFSLNIISYVGMNSSSLTVEQNLFKEGHPLNDPIIGICRNHFTINDPQRSQMSYINYYVNVDENTKYRIRLWDIWH